MDEIPADFDVAVALRDGDERDLARVWNLFHERRLWQRVIEKNAPADGNDEHLVTAQRALAELPDVTAIQALEANARLVDLLTGRRWYVMQDAREARVSWAEIGRALGISRQGAQDFYQRKMESQGPYVGNVHDDARAHAALNPLWIDLFGLDPDITGGKPIGEYLDDSRGEA